MTDPADRLARFTPAAGPDAAELLVRMGRASASTPVRWKLAVAGLLLTNVAALAWGVLRPAPSTPTVIPVVVPVPILEPLPAHPATEPSRYGSLRVHADPDNWPPLETLAGVDPPGPPLTPLAGRRGEID